MKLFLIFMLMLTTIASAKLPVSKKHYDRIISITVKQKDINKIVKDLESIDSHKLKIMRRVYQLSEPHNLANSCLAILYKESHIGDYLINSISGDYGIMGINIKTYMNTYKLNGGYWYKAKLISKLTIDNDLNIAVAIHNLKYWKKYYGDNWRIIWGSYNGGWKPNYNYAKSILTIIKAYKIFFKKHPDVETYIKGR